MSMSRNSLDSKISRQSRHTTYSASWSRETIWTRGWRHCWSMDLLYKRLGVLEHFQSRCIVYAAMTEPGSSVVWGDARKSLRNRLLQRLGGSSLQRTQELFQLGPSLFDGIQVGRIRWQVQQFGSRGLDQFPYSADLVGAEVVHDHHIADVQHRAQHVFHVGQKDVPIRGFLDGHRRQQTAQA